jgi:hypothetical protein
MHELHNREAALVRRQRLQHSRTVCADLPRCLALARRRSSSSGNDAEVNLSAAPMLDLIESDVGSPTLRRRRCGRAFSSSLGAPLGAASLAAVNDRPCLGLLRRGCRREGHVFRHRHVRDEVELLANRTTKALPMGKRPREFTEVHRKLFSGARRLLSMHRLPIWLLARPGRDGGLKGAESNQPVTAPRCRSHTPPRRLGCHCRGGADRGRLEAGRGSGEVASASDPDAPRGAHASRPLVVSCLLARSTTHRTPRESRQKAGSW